MMSASSKNSKLSRDTKTFYPEEYFKRVGYAKASDTHSNAEARVDALGQRVRERFNEDLEYGNAPGNTSKLNSRNLNKAAQNSGGDGRSNASGARSALT